MGRYEDFIEFRQKMNQQLLNEDNLEIKRFFALDERCYQDGALPAKTKELLGLAASLVLRCDDCISYHLLQCRKHGCSKNEILETFSIALIVGGSITIPHLRRALAFWQELEEKKIDK